MLVRAIRRWLAKKITQLNCVVNGHGPITILDRYPSEDRIKLTGTIEGEKFKDVKANQITRVKVRCGRCGRVFLDYAGRTW